MQARARRVTYVTFSRPFVRVLPWTLDHSAAQFNDTSNCGARLDTNCRCQVPVMVEPVTTSPFSANWLGHSSSLSQSSANRLGRFYNLNDEVADSAVCSDPPSSLGFAHRRPFQPKFIPQPIHLWPVFSPVCGSLPTDPVSFCSAIPSYVEPWRPFGL